MIKLQSKLVDYVSRPRPRRTAFRRQHAALVAFGQLLAKPVDVDEAVALFAAGAPKIAREISDARALRRDDARRVLNGAGDPARGRHTDATRDGVDALPNLRERIGIWGA